MSTAQLGLRCGSLVLLALAGIAHAGNANAPCAGPYPVGFRELALPDGREVALWYPAATPAGSNAARSGTRNVASDGVAADVPLAVCPTRWPLVLFSHGVAGCNEQVVFVTEQVARRGYVVAAPNHRDAICGVALQKQFPIPPGATRPSFLLPAQWTPTAWRGRMLDLRDTLRLLREDAPLARDIDFSRIGLMGHSLGGYTVLGMAGGWPDWRLPGVRAVLAFAPYVLPYLDQRRLRDLRVPVMYQVGALDFGITPAVVRSGGAYDASPAPKYLLEIPDVGHLMWTGWPCRDQPDVASCLAHVAAAQQVDAFALAFLDRYLKGGPAKLPAAGDNRVMQVEGRR